MATPVPGCGFGDGDPLTGEGFVEGGYGTHDYGYGSPCTFPSGYIVGGNAVHDNGGEGVVLQSSVGQFPLDEELTVRVNGVIAYSGVSGQGNTVYASSDGSSVSFVIPPLQGTLGPVDVTVQHATGTLTFTGILRVLRYVHRSKTLLMASRFPSPPYRIRRASPRRD